MHGCCRQLVKRSFFSPLDYNFASALTLAEAAIMHWWGDALFLTLQSVTAEWYACRPALSYLYRHDNRLGLKTLTLYLLH